MADTIVVYNQNEPVVVTIPPPDYNVIDISAGLTITIIGGEGGTGATNFLQLTDTPTDYAGQNGKLVAVNTDGTAITFIDAPTGDGTVTSVNTIQPVDGNVTINTDNVAEGSVNQYFTDERVTSSTTVSNNSQYVSNIITGGGLNTNGGYTANSGTNYIDSAISLNSADTLLDTALKAESDRAMAAEAANAADIAQNASDIAANLAAIQSNDGDITNLQNSITAETAARVAADTAIQADVDQNEADSDAADTQLQNNINAEASARIAADNTLQSNIDSLTSLSLADTPSNYGSAGQVLVLNGTADGLVWAANGSGSVAGVSSLNDLTGPLTIASGNDNATISQAGSTITIEVKPQQITENVKNVSGGPLAKGTPVHITSSSGNTSNITAANANASTALECHYILNETLADQGEGEAILVGFINNVEVPDASIYSSGDEVWLADGGGFTTTRPTGAGTLIQQIGVILNVNTSNNTISGIIFGNLVKEDLPNLAQGHTWFGDSSSHPTEYNLQNLINDVTNLTGEVDTNTGDIANLVLADTTLQGNIDAEEAARIAADTTTTNNVTALTTRVDAAELDIDANTAAITAEETARINAVAAVQADVDQNEADADAAISGLDTRVTAAEGNISTNSTSIGSNTTAISNEVNRATAAETTLQSNIDTETTNRQNADTNLNTSIIANTNSINAIKDRVFYQDAGGDDKVTLKPVDDTVKIDIDGINDAIEFTVGNVKSTTIDSAGLSTKELTINNGTADVFSLPTTDGSADQVLTTNGSGVVTWTSKSSSPSTFTVTTETASRNLAASDNTQYLRSTSATAVTFTVPPQSTVTWADYTEIIFEQAGAGQITIAAGAGVTINSSETLKSNKQYAVIALKRVGSDLWTLTGERELV